MTEQDELPAFAIQQEPLGPVHQVLRTPDSAFEGVVSEFPQQPHYFHSKVHGNLRCILHPSKTNHH